MEGVMIDSGKCVACGEEFGFEVIYPVKGGGAKHRHDCSPKWATLESDWWLQPAVLSREGMKAIEKAVTMYDNENPPPGGWKW